MTTKAALPILIFLITTAILPIYAQKRVKTPFQVRTPLYISGMRPFRVIPEK